MNACQCFSFIFLKSDIFLTNDRRKSSISCKHLKVRLRVYSNKFPDSRISLTPQIFQVDQILVLIYPRPITPFHTSSKRNIFKLASRQIKRLFRNIINWHLIKDTIHFFTHSSLRHFTLINKISLTWPIFHINK